jgi:hypothetical protein
LKDSRIARRLGVDHRPSLPQRLNALGLDLGGLAAREWFLQAVARDASRLGGLEIGGDCLDERIRPAVHLGRTSALPSARLSLSRPQSPLGSAAETAIPAIVTLSSSNFHSSGVKLDLTVMCLLLNSSSIGRLTRVPAYSTASSVPAVDEHARKSGGQHREFRPLVRARIDRTFARSTARLIL